MNERIRFPLMVAFDWSGNMKDFEGFSGQVSHPPMMVCNPGRKTKI